MPIANTPAAQLVAYARANPSLIRKRALTFTEYMFPKNGKIPVHYGFYITETTNPNFHEHPFWPVYASKTATVPPNPDIVVHKGAIEEWYLVNATLESHAFHIHQMAFVVEKSFAGIPLTRTRFSCGSAPRCVILKIRTTRWSNRPSPGFYSTFATCRAASSSSTATCSFTRTGA